MWKLREAMVVHIRRFFFFNIAILILIFQIAFASSIFPMNIISNTIYQNANSVPLYIYGQTGGTMAGYAGATSSNMLELTNSSISLSGVVGATLLYRESVAIAVPPNFYYLFNYSGSPNIFNGELITAPNTITLNNSTNLFLLNQQGNGMGLGEVLIILGVIFLVLRFALYKVSNPFEKSEEKDVKYIPQMIMLLVLSEIFMIMGILLVDSPFPTMTHATSLVFNGNTISQTINTTLNMSTTPIVPGYQALDPWILGFLYSFIVVMLIFIDVIKLLNKQVDDDLQLK